MRMRIVGSMVATLLAAAAQAQDDPPDRAGTMLPEGATASTAGSWGGSLGFPSSGPSVLGSLDPLADRGRGIGIDPFGDGAGTPVLGRTGIASGLDRAGGDPQAVLMGRSGRDPAGWTRERTGTEIRDPGDAAVGRR